jgi:hypothetical protein
LKINNLLNELNDVTARDVLKRQLANAEEATGEKPIARETIKVKQIMERKRINSLVNEFAGADSSQDRMICTRILGHKLEMPGSGQWKLITDKQEECWISDQQIYGLVFWDRHRINQRAYLNTEVPDQR